LRTRVVVRHSQPTFAIPMMNLQSDAVFVASVTVAYDVQHDCAPIACLSRSVAAMR
jgi:hypothetical protein